MSRSAIAREIRGRPRPEAAPEPDFQQLFAQAERLHRAGQQRSALSVIAQLADRVTHEPELSLDALLNLIFLRKRICAALQDV